MPVHKKELSQSSVFYKSKIRWMYDLPKRMEVKISKLLGNEREKQLGFSQKLLLSAECVLSEGETPTESFTACELRVLFEVRSKKWSNFRFSSLTLVYSLGVASAFSNFVHSAGAIVCLYAIQM